MNRLHQICWSKVRQAVVFTLMLGAAFKLLAFGREAFIAARFGISSVTDAYFSLQQMPLAVASFMFGPFCRAFTPAYADSKRNGGNIEWLPGVIFYATVFGCLLSLLSLAFSHSILSLFTRTSFSQGWPTLALLSLCYWPIVQIGLFAGIATSYGRNLASLTITGIPYLVMTVGLVGIYLAGALGNLSLPISMSAGFATAGIFSFITVVLREPSARQVGHILRPWKSPSFRSFARQLGASSLENLGYSINQMLILYFMARTCTGAVSANNCASRIGLLGFSLLVQPISQLMQARLCADDNKAPKKTFQKYLIAMVLTSSVLAFSVCMFRFKVAAFIYMRGKFTGAAVDQVAAMLPAWLSYFVIHASNVIIGQYLFNIAKGRFFTRNMLLGYALANLLRFAAGSAISPQSIIWCAVIGDGSALLANLAFTADAWKLPTPILPAAQQQQA